jgi:hypothetical protein
MTPIIILLKRPKKKSSVASIHIAEYIAKTLEGAKMFYADTDHVKGIPSGLDSAILVNSSGAGFASKHAIEETCRVLNTCKNPVYVMNDYKLTMIGQMNSYMRKRGKEPRKFIYWSTVCNQPGWSERVDYVNWNALSTFFHSTPDLVPIQRRGYIYYGALRSGRLPYFTRYFTNPKSKPWFYWSTASKVNPEDYPGANIMPKVSIPEDLTNFLAALYIEDETSHDIYCSPANRFYECLMARVAIYFDKACAGTFKEAGIDVSPYLVNSVEDLFKRYKHTLNDAKVQAKAWPIAKFQKEFLEQYKRAAKQLGLRVKC